MTPLDARRAHDVGDDLRLLALRSRLFDEAAEALLRKDFAAFDKKIAEFRSSTEEM
jgi:hypothetical protein